MVQVTAKIDDQLVKSLDKVARRLGRTRADLVRRAVEHYLADYEDLSDAIDRLRDPADKEVDWDSARHELFTQD